MDLKKLTYIDLKRPKWMTKDKKGAPKRLKGNNLHPKTSHGPAKLCLGVGRRVESGRPKTPCAKQDRANNEKTGKVRVPSVHSVNILDQISNKCNSTIIKDDIEHILKNMRNTCPNRCPISSTNDANQCNKKRIGSFVTFLSQSWQNRKSSVPM